VNVKPKYWELLLQIKLIYQSFNPEIDTIIIDKNYTAQKSRMIILPNDCLALIRFNPIFKTDKNYFEVVFSDNYSKQFKKVFSLYLGYILVNRNTEIPFTCVHVAQTIDGKMATVTGKSKWIGNQENLIHAHRIRALVDAILIGGNTFRIDKPKLDVRLVKGTNPIKIIIANSKLELENLNQGQTYLCSINELEYDDLPEQTEIITIKDETTISSKALLKILKQKGIHSILVEGGAQTIRNFIEEKMVSRIEFHLAPMLFGSGKNSIELKEIQELEQAIVLKNPKYFKMGNAIMTVSNL
jgi:diaminohydroxyphosphoribosylaminopyrimidine deaminase/5-amino-6-(5-phosphoribosylamino)uracil reductase